jgi:predicted dehydrogenase
MTQGYCNIDEEVVMCLPCTHSGRIKKPVVSINIRLRHNEYEDKLTMTATLRVGIVGANATRGWARDAHGPALAKLPRFELVAVSARTQPLAEEAKVVFGAQRAYGDSLAMVRAPDLDIIAVTVKVPEHRAVVLAALEAGKHVYCEWPLGSDLVEAKEMAAAVKPTQHAMIGLQGLSAPAVRQASKLVRDEALGSLRVLRVFSPTAGWGPDAPPHYAYLQDKRSGATLETIAGGHSLAVVEEIAGAYIEVDARNDTLVDRVRIQGTDEAVRRTCADHMMVLGKHAGGCVSTLEVTGGVMARPFVLELIGERGWLKIIGGRAGGYQVGNLRLETDLANSSEPEFAAAELRDSLGVYVAEGYERFADDIRNGTKTVPDFNAAVRLTKLLDSVDRASDSGARQYIER